MSRNPLHETFECIAQAPVESGWEIYPSSTREEEGLSGTYVQLMFLSDKMLTAQRSVL